LFIKSLISRVIILNIVILTIGVGAFSLFFINREHRWMVASTLKSAEVVLATVEKSIFNAMRNGNSADVQTILEMVGRNNSLLAVRIFRPDGTILRSAHPEEIGSRVAIQDLTLFQANGREATYKIDGQEILGIIKPIVSDESCFHCHGFGHKVLGVLDINLSLSETNFKLQQNTQYFMLVTAVIILLLSAGISLVLLRFVKRPIKMLASKMAQVEAGNLSVRLESRYDDEIGRLTTSFNSMVINLEKARHELEQVHYRQMERADRLATVGEMSTGLAHEIKNPLAGIGSAIAVLADDFPEKDPRRDIVREVLVQLARLDKTASDLLSFGRPSPPEFSWVDINSLVKKTFFFIAQHPEAKNIHGINELSPDLPAVWVDEKQIQQVLFNIIINAIQAMKDGGTLLLETGAIDREGKKFVRVRITDSGKGIAPEELGKIFIPFHTTKTQGTGLGLPISRQLLEQHGGCIQVDSNPGKGTTFIIELPVLAQQPRKEVNCAQTQDSGR
jgi:hypothetical protein